MTTDEQLMSSYMKGFNDELDSLPEQTEFNSNLELKAYNIGRLDAWAGDDVESIRNQTTQQIINNIRS
jgi:hypothetical protein